jgi:hypothetical protein
MSKALQCVARILVVVLLLAPLSAFAAYNDVTLTSDAVISVGGYTLDVSGSSAAIQSITVNVSSFSVTLASGSSLTVTSPTLQQLSSDLTTDVTNNTCTGAASSIALAYSGAGTVTNVITPSVTICSGSGASPAPTGGGGFIVGSGPLAPGYVNTNQPVTPITSPVVSTTTSLEAPSTVTPPVSSAMPSSVSFPQNRQMWDEGPDIMALQQYLNTHGFPLASSGVGSPGNETDIFGPLTYAALITFQEAHAAEILTPNGLTKGSGYFGPSTRGFVNRN